MERNNYINTIVQVNTSKNTLHELVKFCDNYKSIVLLGFNDYTKHLINIFRDKDLKVIDINLNSKIAFRGIQIMTSFDDLNSAPEAFVCVDYEELMDYQFVICDSKGYRHTPFHYPKMFGKISTQSVDYFRQDALYKNLLTRTERRGLIDNSMMYREGVFFLLELLKSTLKLPGSVAEIGVWQGGSALYIARLLAMSKVEKNLFLFDFFEEHSPDYPKGIMCIDELKSNFCFYAKTKFISGDIRKTIESISDEKLCFVHYDMGYQQPILDVIVPNLVKGGVILLDNYGHTAAKPKMFDAYFSKYNLCCIRLPYSPQCIVINN